MGSWALANAADNGGLYLSCRNANCTGGAVPPVPVPVPAGLTLVNVADFVQIIGQGATCSGNQLPI